LSNFTSIQTSQDLPIWICGIDNLVSPLSPCGRGIPQFICGAN
jgi:hypothetical protein